MGMILAAAAILWLLTAPRPSAKEALPLPPSSVTEAEGCTVIMVGKEASSDGSTMATHTADCGSCDCGQS